MRALEVKAMEGYKIGLVFGNGVSGIVDLTDLVQKGIFKKLKDPNEFNKVYLVESAVAWSDELEIDLDNIYAELTNSDPSQILHKPVYHAAD